MSAAAEKKPRLAAGFSVRLRRGPDQAIGVMFEACAPFGPWVTS
jgi:hypothetical protein